MSKSLLLSEQAQPIPVYDTVTEFLCRKLISLQADITQTVFFYVKNQTQPDMQLSCNEQCLETLSENSVCVTGCPAGPDPRLGAYGVHGPSARAGSAT